VRIRGYFSNPKGVREQKLLANTALIHFTFLLNKHVLKQNNIKWLLFWNTNLFESLIPNANYVQCGSSVIPIHIDVLMFVDHGRYSEVG
jgi:hypothetical protein